MLALFVQPLKSVTVRLYDPAHNELIFVVDWPVDQEYVYGEVPPDTMDEIEPVQIPLHERSVEVKDKDNNGGSEIV